MSIDLLVLDQPKWEWERWWRLENQRTATNPELEEVHNTILNWHFENCKPYAPIENELCVIGHLVFPQGLQAKALSLAREGHLGIVSERNCGGHAWIKQLRNTVRHVNGCQIVARPDPPEPRRNKPLPDGLWQDVAIDLLGPLPSNHSILEVVDYYGR